MSAIKYYCINRSLRQCGLRYPAMGCAVRSNKLVEVEVLRTRSAIAHWYVYVEEYLHRDLDIESVEKVIKNTPKLMNVDFIYHHVKTDAIKLQDNTNIACRL